MAKPGALTQLPGLCFLIEANLLQSLEICYLLEELNENDIRWKNHQAFTAREDLMKFNLPIHRKLFLSHFLAVLLVCGTAGVYFYLSAVENLKVSLQSRLSNSAALLSQILDATKLDSIRQESDQALPVYREYLKLLRIFRRANPDIAYMYVMRRVGDRIYFVIDSDETEAQALPGREYLTAVPALLEGFSHPSVDREIVTDEWGSTLSGYAPLKGGEGIYLIGIDMDATEVHNKFRKLQFSGLICLLFGCALALFLSRFLASRVTTPISLLISRCKAIAEGQFDDQVTFRNRDELDGLITAINDMSTRLAESREERRLAEVALRRANDNLELRIAERTRNLSELNEKLLDEVDIRNKAMDALRISEERYRDLADLLPQPVFEVDSSATLTFLNRAGFEAFGYVQNDFDKGLKLDEIFADDESKKITQETIMRLSGRKVEGIDHEARRRDGSTFPVCTYVNPIMSGEGSRGLRGIILDMSEHKRMEEELLKAQKLESISVLAAGIAHDFNNLLTTIMGAVSLARDLSKPEDKLNKLLNNAERASLQARDLAKQLISLTKGGAPVRGIFSLRDLIKGAVEVAMSGSDLKYSVRREDNLWPLFCDPEQIHQMVVNLVMNSREAMPEGGVVEIELENAELASLDVPSLKAGKYVKLTIKDCGVGIPEERLPRIFDPYFSTKQRGAQKGMGLGLTIAYAIAKRHEGHISLRSDPEIGTEVEVYLPASEQQLDKRANYSELPPLPCKGRVLFLEDDEMIRDLAGQMLNHLGYELQLAQDGAEAMQLFKEAKAKEHPFDLVILDLTVRSGMGGKEAIMAMRQIDASVKAIATSSCCDDPVMTNFASYGFQGAIPKPFQIQELTDVLQKVFQEENA
jgi:two-component system cell cycle sensor histidine kinase/response regulator CckA